MTHPATGHAAGVEQDRLLHVLEHLQALPAGDVAAALAAAAQAVAAAFGADKVDVFLLDPDAATLVALGTSDTPMGRAQHALGLDRLPLANGGRAAEVFATGRPYRGGRVDEDAGELAGIKGALGIRSALMAPFLVAGERRGLLQVDSARPDAFTANDLRRLEVVAGWVGLLAERAEHARAAAAGERAAALSHDLRTPLAGIELALGLLAAGAAACLAPDERDLLDVARRNARRLTILVEDLLAANQADAGTLAIHRAPLDLRAVVADAAAAVRPLLDDKGQALATDLPGPLPVAGDARRLEQVVINLLVNAHRHTPRGARIAVTGAADGAGVRLVVADDGPGVPADQLERIFARHHRLGASGGSGLGLALSREIVERHGGRIWAESPPGGGAAFHVALPRDPQAAAAAPA